MSKRKIQIYAVVLVVLSIGVVIRTHIEHGVPQEIIPDILKLLFVFTILGGVGYWAYRMTKAVNTIGKAAEQQLK